MHPYTINGTTYIAHNAGLFTKGETISDVEAFDLTGYYLYDNDICRLDYTSFTDNVEVCHPDNPSDNPSQYVDANEFEEAIRLNRVRPDDINECPDCGEWAGSADDDPCCVHCGYGLDD